VKIKKKKARVGIEGMILPSLWC
jgi:hypothetical protein